MESTFGFAATRSVKDTKKKTTNSLEHYSFQYIKREEKMKFRWEKLTKGRRNIIYSAKNSGQISAKGSTFLYNIRRRIFCIYISSRIFSSFPLFFASFILCKRARDSRLRCGEATTRFTWIRKFRILRRTITLFTIVSQPFFYFYF